MIKCVQVWYDYDIDVALNYLNQKLKEKCIESHQVISLQISKAHKMSLCCFYREKEQLETNL